MNSRKHLKKLFKKTVSASQELCTTSLRSLHSENGYSRVHTSIYIYPCSGPDRTEATQVTNPPSPLYFCAQARYLRALGLRRGLRCPEDVSMKTQVSQSVPQDCPRCSKEATKVPKRETKGAQCSPHSMLWHSKPSSKESYIHQNSRSTAPAATMLL